MATGKRRYIEKRIETLEAMLADMDATEARFGTNKDYANGDVLMFEMDYTNGIYTFVVIKAAGKWYISSRFDNALTWDELVEKYLKNAERAFKAKKWTEL